MSTDESLVELLEKLSDADGVPGLEDEVRAIFEARWAGLGELRHDGLGGVILDVAGRAAPGVTPPRVAVECHTDEVGFMVRLVTASGLLRVVPLGGWWNQALPGQRLRLLVAGGEASAPVQKLPAVIGATPPHLLGADGAKDRMVDVKELLVDVGAASKDDVEKLGLRPGSFAVPASSFTRLAGGRRVMGKAFDDRVGCAVCLRALERAAASARAGSPLPCTVVGVASAQEEVGLRGVRVAAHLAEPDVAIVVEGSPADDVTSSRDEAQGRLGDGVQIRAFDPSMVASPRFVELAIEAARALGIPHQLAVRTSGGTDAGQLHLHRRGVPTIVLAAPVRYAHSRAGIVDLGDVEAVERLVQALLERLDRDTIERRLLPWERYRP
jgi:putative aminopeptidase FrvX